MSDHDLPSLTRRSLITLVGTTAALTACGSEPGEGGGSGSSTTSTSSSAGSGGTGGDATTSSSTSGGAGGAGGVGGEPTCPELDPSCEETLENILGPFYRAGAPFTTKLDNPSGLGDPLRIEGTVYATDCVTPLGGAIVEVWQADSEGDYDNQNGDPGPNVWILRAQIEADACGRYAYDSIIPGKYLNGGTYRPAHIHYRVSHPLMVEALVTQLFFEGDPDNVADPWFDPAAAVALTERAGVLQGTFDVVLPTT